MDLKKLEQYYNDGWLIKQTHPTLPLTIWNYSQTTQFERNWDEVTLACRGLVTDDNTGNVVARPFRKFFNIEESKHTPTKEYSVFSKMDGSLGICFFYNNEWIFASRGSFTSDQAIKGKELLNKYDMELLSTGYTYLFEIIFESNRIVVSYDYEDVVLLGCIEITDGTEIDIHTNYYKDNFNVVKKLSTNLDFVSLKNLDLPNEEGFVIHFSNGHRVKIKFEEYCRLHRIMTEASTTAIWDILRNDDSMEEFLKEVPDEFYVKIKDFKDSLEDEYWEIADRVKGMFSIIYKDGMTPRDFSKEVRYIPQPYVTLLWCQFNMKMSGYSECIWSSIKPEYRKL